MKIIKETTLHPEGNDGVDLYPKTSIKQVENLSDTLTGINQTDQNLTLNKLDKPATPSAESAVVIGTDGTVNTKPLSEIGGGKLYMHEITYMDGPLSFFKVVVYSTQQNAYTAATFVSNFLKLERGNTKDGIGGTIKVDRSLFYPVYSIGLSYDNVNTLEILGIKSDGSLVTLSYPDYTSISMSDVVTEL